MTDDAMTYRYAQAMELQLRFEHAHRRPPLDYQELVAFLDAEQQAGRIEAGPVTPSPEALGRVCIDHAR